MAGTRRHRRDGVAANRLLSALGALLVLLSVTGASIAFAHRAAAQTEVDVVGAGGLVPDLVVVAAAGEADQAVGSLIERFDRVDGVGRVAAVEMSEDRTALYLFLGPGDETNADGRGSGRSVDEVVDELRMAGEEADVELLIGGRAVIDAELADRIDGAALWLVALAAALAVPFAFAFGWRRGVLTGVALTAAVLAAGRISGQVGGPFDGTFSTGPVVGSFVTMIVGVALALRLLVWFRSPIGADEAAVIRNGVTHIATEVGLLLAGLSLTAVVVELLDRGRSPMTTVSVAALVGAVVVVVVMAPGLALVGTRPEPRPDAFPLTLPDGGRLPLPLMAAVAAILVVLSLFAFGSPSNQLLSVDDLPADGEAATVAELLAGSGGDATSSIAVTVTPLGTDGGALTIDDLVVEVASWPGVASTHVAPTPQDADQPERPTVVESGREDLALIVPAAAARTADSQDLAARLVATWGDDEARAAVTVHGSAVEAVGPAGSRSTVLIAVALLALVAGAAVLALTEQPGQAAITLALRLLGGTAVVGGHRLLQPEATVAELVAVLGLASVAAGMFELEFLQRRPGWSNTWFGSGQCAAVALAVTAVSAVVLALLAVVADTPGVFGFAVAVVVAGLIELVAGMWLLRSALLGRRAAFHTAARPVRQVIHGGTSPTATVGSEDPSWRRVVGDLIQAEFRLQADPDPSALEQVFVRDTPLYRKVRTHNDNLSSAGLRVVGRSPRLRSIKSLSGRSSITLAVTVDHPERRLVDREGQVVGVRKPERRSEVLWLSGEADGAYRIAESVELGSVPLEDPDLEHDLDQEDGGAVTLNTPVNIPTERE